MKKNNNKTLKVASLMMGVTVIAASLVSGTYAKYTSSAEGTDTATVAKWSIQVNGDEIAVSPATTIDFDLFDTINEFDTSTTESDVFAGKIAPGTGGSFDLKIDNLSEVTAKYKIELEETSNTSNIPIEYSSDGETWVMAGSFADITNENLAMTDGTETETIYWRWAFTGDESTNYKSTQTDETDTALGIAAQTTAPTVTVKATITAEQVD